jgi:hypothetical protein
VSDAALDVKRRKVAWRYEREAEGAYTCGYCDRVATHVATETTFAFYNDGGGPSLSHHLRDDVCDEHLRELHPDVDVVGEEYQ